MKRLTETAWDLLAEAADGTGSRLLYQHLRRFDEPLRIAIAGPAQSGKSTLVNALMGEEIGPIANHAVTWYQDGPQPHVVAYTADGQAQELSVARSGAGIWVDQARWPSGDVEDVVVTWPTRALRNVTLMDIPATADETLSTADALLYLTPDAHGTDLEPLEAMNDGVVGRAAPISTLTVLSRADEVGGGRIDALITARQLARQMQKAPDVSMRCMGVVALSPLVALASRVLTEADYEALHGMATAHRSDLDTGLLSVDRFTAPDFPLPIEAGVRRALLDRFGIHGVRLATTLIRSGTDSRATLAAELLRRSGLAELRESMRQYFTERFEVLKVRAALAAIEEVARSLPDHEAQALAARVEQIIVAAHDFRELRLLAALRASSLGFDTQLHTEAYRLIGGNGPQLAPRLGVEDDTDAYELRAVLRDSLQRWQFQALREDLGQPQRRAAKVVVRSCEAIAMELSELD